MNGWNDRAQILCGTSHDLRKCFELQKVVSKIIYQDSLSSFQPGLPGIVDTPGIYIYLSGQFIQFSTWSTWYSGYTWNIYIYQDSLSSFLPSLPGIVDTPGSQDNSSLRSANCLVHENIEIDFKGIEPFSQIIYLCDWIV